MAAVAVLMEAKVDSWEAKANSKEAKANLSANSQHSARAESVMQLVRWTP
jgi:hypothetical protein